MPQRDARPGILREAERAVTIAHAEAVAAFTAQNRISREDIDIVGFHGQTVLHRPAQKMTVQIGDAAALAKAIHIPVMHDFRAADVAAGGQGAPFVPVYHRALAQSLEREGPVVVVNIGGVSNITYIDGADTLIACDTGPGNALLDDFMFRMTGQRVRLRGPHGRPGRTPTRRGSPAACEHPFFALPPPKSLDRNDFASLVLPTMSPADGAATLTAFTAAAIARIVPLLPKPPRSWIVAGGGARNLTMLRMLRERLQPATVESADALGWSARCDRGAGVWLSGGARPERPAAELSRHHGRADPDDGWGYRAALTLLNRRPSWRASQPCSCCAPFPPWRQAPPVSISPCRRRSGCRSRAGPTGSFRPAGRECSSSASAGGARSRNTAMVRLGASFGNGLSASTSAISAAVRTSTPTGLPA